MKLSILTLFLASVVQADQAYYAQLSSTIDQPNGGFGVDGKPITYDSQDALFGISWEGAAPEGSTTTGEGSKVILTKDADYFFFAAPQVAGLVAGEEYIADYWLSIDEEFVANSAIRLYGTKEDVIGVGAVIPFTAGQTLEFIGGGKNSVNLAITEEGEPLVPSIIFSVFELAVPIYAQLSSSITQTLGPFGSGIPIAFDAIDGLKGMTFDPATEPTKVFIDEPGTYMIIIAPQVGGVLDDDSLATADFWVRIDGEDVANTNVRWQAHAHDTDVIIIQGVYAGLAAGQYVEVIGSGPSSQVVLIEEVGQPAVPSIIVTFYKIDDEFPYAQLSSSVTQMNAPLGVGAPIIFDSIDALSKLGFNETMPNQITVMEDAAYFILAAPQVGPVDTSLGFVADYWVSVNGEAAANSNVRIHDDFGMGNDVIVCQGVYELAAGDVVQVMASGVNSYTEAIVEEGEPLVPSIIFSMHKV